jgi:hypothetical protein
MYVQSNAPNTFAQQFRQHMPTDPRVLLQSLSRHLVEHTLSIAISRAALQARIIVHTAPTCVRAQLVLACRSVGHPRAINVAASLHSIHRSSPKRKDQCSCRYGCRSCDQGRSRSGRTCKSLRWCRRKLGLGWEWCWKSSRTESTVSPLMSGKQCMACEQDRQACHNRCRHWSGRRSKHREDWSRTCSSTCLLVTWLEPRRAQSHSRAGWALGDIT